MIKLGQYNWIYSWRTGVPVPKCDSCDKKEATHKIYVPDKIGIRLCDGCLDGLTDELT